MPLVLPSGVIAVPAHDRSLLTGTRSTTFTYDLLGFGTLPGGISNEVLIGPLKGVKPSGSLAWTSSASVKGSGNIDVVDYGQEIDWLNVRIRPNVLIEGPNGDVLASPLGVFLPTAPKEAWSDAGRVWNVELLDKSSVLDQDVVGDKITGTAETYSLPEGSNVIEAIIDLIERAGETTQAIQPDPDAILAGPMTWDAGTTSLKVINDLLSAANYFSIWCDEQGQFQCSKYTSPASRGPRFLTLQPFTDGPTSVVAPDWNKDVDIYAIPNKVVAIQQGDSEEAGLIATVTNDNPDSPYSYSSRGRWITKVYDQVEAVDETALTAYAQRMLAASTSVTGGASFNHLLLPGLRVNDVIRFTNRGMDALCTIDKTEISLDPVGLCSTDITEVVIT